MFKSGALPALPKCNSDAWIGQETWTDVSWVGGELEMDRSIGRYLHSTLW